VICKFAVIAMVASPTAEAGQRVTTEFQMAADFGGGVVEMHRVAAPSSTRAYPEPDGPAPTTSTESF
jgi:hypothetical protein